VWEFVAAMTKIDRRKLLASIALSSATWTVSAATAQQPQGQSAPAAPAPPVPAPRFTYEDVTKRARDLAGAALVPPQSLPEPLAKMDAESWGDIRFRPDRAALSGNGTMFRLQSFHLGAQHRRPITINTIRDGIVTPMAYSSNLFDYGRNKFEKPLPVNTGFAGFRLHFPLNDPRQFDEVFACLGDQFQILGRGQRYGLAAGTLLLPGAGVQQPFLREVWIETPESGAERITFYALVDSEVLTAAYRFDLTPGQTTAVDVRVTLFARKSGVQIGLSPLNSSFFSGENDRRIATDFRPELHNSDGLLMNNGVGEWLWRPLRNPAGIETSSFMDKDPKGFGLAQRDRTFEHYQDLDGAYELRPTYWVEPQGSWGEGLVQLIESPAPDETAQNISAAFVPKATPEPGRPMSFGWRITSGLEMPRLPPLGRSINTYQTQAKAVGAKDPAPPNARRFIIDFAGGDLPYFQSEPKALEVVASTSKGRILQSFVAANPHTKGFRVGVDVQVDPVHVADVRVALNAGGRAITETWTMPWKSE
jgi:glucans biosynthesis protein